MTNTAGSCDCTDIHATFNLTDHLCWCNIGYYDDGSICTSCSNGCVQCNNNIDCKECADPINMKIIAGACVCLDQNAFINSANNQCQCKQGYYLNTNGLCQ